MTKEEIKALISAKITGQGNQVDAGGALDAILNAIVDIIPAGYELPVATDETLGGIKVGSNLSITEEGVLSAQGGAQPLVIIGTVSDGAFTPNAGQPTFEQAKAAFLSGIPVFVNMDLSVVGYGDVIAKITSYGSYYDTKGAGLGFSFVVFGDGDTVWLTEIGMWIEPSE